MGALGRFESVRKKFFSLIDGGRFSTGGTLVVLPRPALLYYPPTEASIPQFQTVVHRLTDFRNHMEQVERAMSSSDVQRTEEEDTFRLRDSSPSVSRTGVC